VIAQDILNEFSDKGLDATEWGVLCFDKWDDQIIHMPAIIKNKEDDKGNLILETELDENGDPILEPYDNGEEVIMVEKKKIVTYVQCEAHDDIIPAGERYGVRYSQVAQLDVALERRERAKLEAKIKEVMRVSIK
jgi:hypothetical protein